MGGIHVGVVYGLLAASLCVFVLAVGALLELRLTRRTSRDTGTPPDGGSVKRSASTTERARGTLTPETATSAGCSFSSARGRLLADVFDLIAQHPENSYTVRGSSTGVTVTRGASGGLPGHAD